MQVKKSGSGTEFLAAWERCFAGWCLAPSSDQRVKKVRPVSWAMRSWMCASKPPDESEWSSRSGDVTRPDPASIEKGGREKLNGGCQEGGGRRQGRQYFGFSSGGTRKMAHVTVLEKWEFLQKKVTERAFFKGNFQRRIMKVFIDTDPKNLNYIFF